MCVLGNLPRERLKGTSHVLKADGGAGQGKGIMAASGAWVLSVYGIAHLGPDLRVSSLLSVHLYNKRTQEKAIVQMMVQEEFSL